MEPPNCKSIVKGVVDTLGTGKREPATGMIAERLS
jgi:hypothetical protein